MALPHVACCRPRRPLAARSLLAPGLLVALLSALCVGCATKPVQYRELASQVIQFDEDGNTIDLRTGQAVPRTAASGVGKRSQVDQFDDMLQAMESHFADQEAKERDSTPANSTTAAASATTKPRKILLFVHGGLDEPAQTLKEARARLDHIAAQDPTCYPMFVVWDSGLPSTYREHLLHIRQGRKDAKTEQEAKFTWPIYFLVDVLRAIARAPTVWIQQRTTDDQAAVAEFSSVIDYLKKNEAFKGVREKERAAEAQEWAEAWVNLGRNSSLLALYAELNRRYAADWGGHDGKSAKAIALSVGPDFTLPSDSIKSGIVYTLTLPTKMLSAPLIDAFGSAGWQNMSRRTQTIVEGTSYFQVGPHATPQEVRDYLDRGTRGGLDDFIAALARRAAHAPAGRPYQITLVGHSMGAMVLNEMLLRQTRREVAGQPPLPVTNIVYMAAACSIRSFAQAVVPFMELHAHHDTRFYNLCLHPTAELTEAEGFDLIPRGSLLCWLDDFLAAPPTPLDRTLGRWDNILQAAYVIPPNLRGRVAIKAFARNRRPEDKGTESNFQPQMHGDFSGGPYWDENFWKPAPPVNPGGKRMELIEHQSKQLSENAPYAPRATPAQQGK